MSAAKLGKTEAAILSALKLDRESWVKAGGYCVGRTTSRRGGISLVIESAQRRALHAARRLDSRGLVEIESSGRSVAYDHRGVSSSSFYWVVRRATASRDEIGAPR